MIQWAKNNFLERRGKGFMTEKSRSGSSMKSNNKHGWLFTSLYLILLGVFLFYPIVYSLYLSTMSSKGIVQKFVGFGNYVKLFRDPLFILALKNTLIIFLIRVPITLFLALIFAIILNDKTIKFKGFFRTAFFLPAVTSLIASTMLFKIMFSLNGFINVTLLNMHIIKSNIPWLFDPFWTTLVLLIILIWRWVGYNMIFYLAGLQNIPKEIYEAAKIDGANEVKQFFYITIPLLKPLILFTIIMSTIRTLQLFDEPMNLVTQAEHTTITAGPGNSLLTLGVYIYNLCFKFMPNFGYAASVSYAIVLIVALLSIIYFKVIGSEK